jgi:hypothetical protein
MTSNYMVVHATAADADTNTPVSKRPNTISTAAVGEHVRAALRRSPASRSDAAMLLSTVPGSAIGLMMLPSAYAQVPAAPAAIVSNAGVTPDCAA